MTNPLPTDRRQAALDVRHAAAELAASRAHPKHASWGDELRFRHPDTGKPSHLASFTKGLPHDPATGLLSDASHFQLFVRAVDSGDVDDMRRVPLGPPPRPDGSRFGSGIASAPTKADVRAWESMAAGLTFDLQGPDAQAVTMPPAPELDSPELAAEMTELYWMALLRDVPFQLFSRHHLVAEAIAGLNATDWVRRAPHAVAGLSDAERARLRGPFDQTSVFRGTTPGDHVGPYISQFLLVGTRGLDNAHEPAEGFVQYGAARIDQRVRNVTNVDFMTTWQAWLDVQDGADLRGRESYSQSPPHKFRFITTPRDLATYVHYDALYQAYLNACIILLDIGAPFDAGLPFQLDDDVDKQQGFATFGGPHVLTLVTEVATRALKAIRFQKFNVHRRCRPEAIGGLVERFHHDRKGELFAPVRELHDALGPQLLDRVARHNSLQNGRSDHGNARRHDVSPSGSHETRLLPMAFPEGSPMHPSYGAGHAAVAGACVTLLKAFFDHAWKLPFAFAPSDNGQTLEPVALENKLTVEGELNKVCSNISIGRNWAGVHYYTDYRESINLGEAVALGLLEEQKLTYGENFSMTVPLFDGSVHRI